MYLVRKTYTNQFTQPSFSQLFVIWAQRPQTTYRIVSMSLFETNFPDEHDRGQDRTHLSTGGHKPQLAHIDLNDRSFGKYT